MVGTLRARKGPRYHAAREFLGRSRWDANAFDLAEVKETGQSVGATQRT